MSRVAVIGGGAAGMMAAIAAAQNGHTVSLYEKNEKLGKKLFITGKGRCNLTNNCGVEELLQAVCVNARFLYSAFYGFDSQSTIRFFEEEGMQVKTERGQRVFPVSDHSSDVIAALTRKLHQSGVAIYLNHEVKRILTEEDGDAGSGVDAADSGISEQRNSEQKDSAQKNCARQSGKSGTATHIVGLQLTNGQQVAADAVIVATGGLSYPGTGSTGDGYRFAEKTGHRLSERSPSLVPMETEGTEAQQMQGLSLRNVEVSIYDGKKELFREFGEMMFTHFGVTGPLVLTASSVIQKRLKEHPLSMFIDCKPALTEEQLDRRILREFDMAKNKQFKNVLGTLFPSKMIPVMIHICGIPGERPVHEITREERKNLIQATKHFPLTLVRLRDYNEAIITRGGVSVKEINPTTMESKKVKGLCFAGEVLDVDAVTGGFNLQIAWSTGYAAGSSIPFV
ncbi:MAG: NAD(P)/FAD-dependent oxidoreductase [Lachnospiraceae bacterium]|nr:NAD(P)/FAD-dependent oxidoreductase [Lachnospiraceae bacterium]